MKPYIDKNALLARIKKLKMDIGNIFNEYDEGFWEGRTTAFDDVICALSNLEVKEVEEPTAADRGMAEEIIINLKRVEQDYHIDLTREMEWLRNLMKKGK